MRIAADLSRRKSGCQHEPPGRTVQRQRGGQKLRRKRIQRGRAAEVALGIGEIAQRNMPLPIDVRHCSPARSAPSGLRHDNPLPEARQFGEVCPDDRRQPVTVTAGVGVVMVYHDYAAQQLRSRLAVDVDEEGVGGRQPAVPGMEARAQA